MNSIPLFSVEVPRSVNLLGKSVQYLTRDNTTKPRVLKLEWLPDKRVILVEVEKKEEMPNICMIPQERCSVITPMKEWSEQNIKWDMPPPPQEPLKVPPSPALTEAARSLAPDKGADALQAHREKVEAKPAKPKKRRGRPPKTKKGK